MNSDEGVTGLNDFHQSPSSCARAPPSSPQSPPLRAVGAIERVRGSASRRCARATRSCSPQWWQRADRPTSRRSSSAASPSIGRATPHRPQPPTPAFARRRQRLRCLDAVLAPDRRARASCDVFNRISTSGNSPNVLAACHRVARRGLVTVGMTGQPWRQDGGVHAITACAAFRAIRRRSRKGQTWSATSSAAS